MRLAALLVIAACGAAACDGDEPGPPVVYFADGQRLRAQYAEFQGGVKLFRGFFDTVLGEHCRFDQVGGPSGADYCLPTSREQVFLNNVTNFADPACTVPTIFVDDSSSVVEVIAGNACDAEPMVYQVGPISTTHYRKAPDGSCTMTPANIYRRLGALIALDTFVSAFQEQSSALLVEQVAAHRELAIRARGADAVLALVA